MTELFSESNLASLPEWFKSLFQSLFGFEMTQLSDPATLLGFAATFAVIGLVLWAMNALALFRIFKKQDIAGWKGFVPVYNRIVFCKLTLGSGWFFLLSFVPVANIVVFIISMVRLAKLCGKKAGAAIPLILVNPIAMLMLAYSEQGKKVWEHGKTIIQTAFFALTNSFMVGWFKGSIYQGNLKYICVPGMNCYSCPGAWGSCPIGSLQAVLNGFDTSKSWFDPKTGTYVKAPLYWFAFYVVGLIVILGGLLGRLICGLLCPFGWVQDLIHKIPTPKLKLPRDERLIARQKNPKLIRGLLTADKYARYLKYVFLFVMVIFLPLFVKADPWFCKYVCPSGLLIGGVPLMSLNQNLAAAAGSLTLLKGIILVVILVWAIFQFRPFCKYICPLGAIYSFLNPVSMYRYGIDDSKCHREGGCSVCAMNCKMGVDVVRTPNSPECIRCGGCKASCPHHAIHSGFRFKTEEGTVIRTGRRRREKFPDFDVENSDKNDVVA